MGNVVEITEEPTDPIGGATGEKKFFNVRFLGKGNERGFPFTIANEVVAGQIGLALGLNLPTVLTHKTDGGRQYLLSQWQDFVPPPAAAVAKYVEENRGEVHGAIVFDLFIANNDRAFGPTRRNLDFDGEGRLYLYDQGNACFYRDRTSKGIHAGIPRLLAVENDLAALFSDVPWPKQTYLQLLTDWSLVEMWCERIAALPDFLLEAAVNRIPRYLGRPGPEERDALVAWLKKRKTCLIKEIVKHRDPYFLGLPERNTPRA